MNGKTRNTPGGADSVKKLDWLDPSLTYTAAYIEGIRMVQHNGKRGRCHTFPLGSLWGEQAHIVTPRHIGTQLGNGSMLIMLLGANTVLCPWRNENCSHGFVSQESMSGTSWPQSLRPCRRRCKAHVVGLLNLREQWGLRCLLNLLLLLQRKIM